MKGLAAWSSITGNEAVDGAIVALVLILGIGAITGVVIAAVNYRIAEEPEAINRCEAYGCQKPSGDGVFCEGHDYMSESRDD